MAFGFMNTRRYTLTYLFLGSLFMNCISIYWTMWSVLTMSTFMLMLTDFMFFGVRASRVRAGRGRAAAGGDQAARQRSRSAASLHPGCAPRPRVPVLTRAELRACRRTTSSGDPELGALHDLRDAVGRVLCGASLHLGVGAVNIFGEPALVLPNKALLERLGPRFWMNTRTKTRALRSDAARRLARNQATSR